MTTNKISSKDLLKIINMDVAGVYFKEIVNCFPKYNRWQVQRAIYKERRKRNSPRLRIQRIIANNKNEIEWMVNFGMPVIAIGKKFGMSNDLISKYLNLPKRRKTTQLTHEKIEIVLEMYKKNFPLSEIGFQTKTTRDTLLHFFKIIGLPILVKSPPFVSKKIGKLPYESDKIVYQFLCKEFSERTIYRARKLYCDFVVFSPEKTILIEGKKSSRYFGQGMIQLLLAKEKYLSLQDNSNPIELWLIICNEKNLDFGKEKYLYKKFAEINKINVYIIKDEQKIRI